MTKEELEILIYQLTTLKNRFEPQILSAAKLTIVDDPFVKNEVWQPLLPKFTKLTDDLETKLIADIKDYAKSGKSYLETIQTIKAKFGTTEHVTRVMFNTANAALRRQEDMIKFLEYGVEYFEYLGIAPQRKFCKERFNRIFHISEIYKMDNRQGLPVWIFCGGYNCQHFWNPVWKEDYERKGVKI